MVQCSEIWPFALSPSLGSSRQSLWAPWEQLQPWQNKYPHTYREWKSGPSVRQQGLCLFKFLHTTQLRRISPYSAVAHLINRKNCTFRKWEKCPPLCPGHLQSWKQKYYLVEPSVFSHTRRYTGTQVCQSFTLTVRNVLYTNVNKTKEISSAVNLHSPDP